MLDNRSGCVVLRYSFLTRKFVNARLGYSTRIDMRRDLMNHAGKKTHSDTIFERPGHRHPLYPSPSPLDAERYHRSQGRGY